MRQNFTKPQAKISEKTSNIKVVIFGRSQWSIHRTATSPLLDSGSRVPLQNTTFKNVEPTLYSLSFHVIYIKYRIITNVTSSQQNKTLPDYTKSNKNTPQ
jgi:hypothetical protein